MTLMARAVQSVRRRIEGELQESTFCPKLKLITRSRERESTEAKIERTPLIHEAKARLCCRTLRGSARTWIAWKRKPGVEHGAHRDEEARELHVSVNTGLEQ